LAIVATANPRATISPGLLATAWTNAETRAQESAALRCAKLA